MERLKNEWIGSKMNGMDPSRMKMIQDEWEGSKLNGKNSR